MTITRSKPPEALIELDKQEVLTLGSTYEAAKIKYKKADYKSIKLKVFDNLLEVELIDKDGKKTTAVFSDTWDFIVQ